MKKYKDKDYRDQRGQRQSQMKTENPNNVIIPGIHLFDNGNFLKWLSSNPNEINLSLFYKKFVRWYKKSECLYLKMDFDKDRPDDRKKKRDYKNDHLKKIVELSGKPLPYYAKLKNRFFFDKKHSFNLNTKTRLLVGFAGSDSVVENSISLHPLYGFPIIPGSSLKGITRYYCKEFKNIDPETFKRMFGNASKEEESREGEVVFMDAWPDEWENNLLELDVMSPHYSEYYRGTEFPSDDSDPIPIIYLAIPKGIKFRFSLLPSRICRDKAIIYTAICYLKDALKNIGVGAKTGSSYGYFEEPCQG